MGDVLRLGSARSVVATAATFMLLAGCQQPQQRRYMDVYPMVERAAHSRPVGAIAVVGASYLPGVNLGDLTPRPQANAGSARDTGKDAAVGAAAGASIGAMAGLAAVVGAMAACLTPAAPATCTAFWSYVAGGALVGAGAGVALGQTAGEKGGAPVNATVVAVRETPLQDFLRAAVAARCGTLAAAVCAETHFPGPEYPGALPNYAPIAGAPADAVLEVEVLELSMPRSLFGSPVALTIRARARLVRAASGQALYRGIHAFSSESLPMDDWVANDAAKLREALQRGFAELAGKIVNAALLPERESPQA